MSLSAVQAAGFSPFFFQPVPQNANYRKFQATGDTSVGGIQSANILLEVGYEYTVGNKDPLVNVFEPLAFNARAGFRTTTTNSFTQPAVGGSATVNMAALSGIYSGGTIVIDGAGTYTATHSGSNPVTLVRKNVNDADVAASIDQPTGTVITSGKGVNFVLTTFRFKPDILINDCNASATPNNPGIIFNEDTLVSLPLNCITRVVKGGPLYGYIGENPAIWDGGNINQPSSHGGSGASGGEPSLASVLKAINAKTDDELIHAIPHALALQVDATKYLSALGTAFVSPANRADFWTGNYTSVIPTLKMGTRLAIPSWANIKELRLKTRLGIALAWAHMIYGAVIIDTTGWDAVQEGFTQECFPYISATFRTTRQFTQPAIGVSVVVSVDTTEGVIPTIGTCNGAQYFVSGIDPVAKTLVLTNLGGANNKPAAETLPMGQFFTTLVPSKDLLSDYRTIYTALQEFSNAAPTDFGKSPTIQTGTTYTLSPLDNGTTIYIANAGAITLTLPQMYAGFNCTVVQDGAGAITPTAGSGVTRNIQTGKTVSGGQNTSMLITYKSATVVAVTGTLA